MDLKDFYQEIGGSCEEVLGRFSGMEAMVKKFLGKFKDDLSYQKLEEAVAKMDATEIDHAAHTLKGVCSNLGFSRLQKYAEDLMFHVREQKPMEEVPALMEKVKTEYEAVMDRVRSLLGE